MNNNKKKKNSTYFQALKNIIKSSLNEIYTFNAEFQPTLIPL